MHALVLLQVNNKEYMYVSHMLFNQLCQMVSKLSEIV